MDSDIFSYLNNAKKSKDKLPKTLVLPSKDFVPQRDVKTLDELLQLLAEAPHRHMRHEITQRLSDLVGEDKDTVYKELIKIKEDCEWGDYASSFALTRLGEAIEYARNYKSVSE